MSAGNYLSAAHFVVQRGNSATFHGGVLYIPRGLWGVPKPGPWLILESGVCLCYPRLLVNLGVAPVLGSEWPTCTRHPPLPWGCGNQLLRPPQGCQPRGAALSSWDLPSVGPYSSRHTVRAPTAWPCGLIFTCPQLHPVTEFVGCREGLGTGTRC